VNGGAKHNRELWDPGAQPERTYQAWTRTALAFTVCALLATRLAPNAGPIALLASLSGVAAALLVVRRQKHRLHSMIIRAAPGAVLMMTALTVLLAIAALTLFAIPAIRASH
jgi:uncharacterized membrane protein YidH (DUF202 family)